MTTETNLTRFAAADAAHTTAEHEWLYASTPEAAAVAYKGFCCTRETYNAAWAALSASEKCRVDGCDQSHLQIVRATPWRQESGA
jgi:hypothetical protein